MISAPLALLFIPSYSGLALTRGIINFSGKFYLLVKSKGLCTDVLKATGKPLSSKTKLPSSNNPHITLK